MALDVARTRSGRADSWWHPRHVLPVGALLFLAVGGALKGTIVGATVWDIDTTLIAGLVCAVYIATGAVAALVRRDSLTPLLLAGGLGMALVIPGALSVASTSEYADHKVWQSLPLVLLALAGGVIILRTQSRRQTWIAALAVLGVVMGVLALLAPDAIQAQQGALAAAGSSTIALGRASGASVVVLGTFTLVGDVTRPQRLALLGLLLVTAGFTLAAGSRGPVLAAVAAVLFVAALSGGRRGVRIFLTVSALVAVVMLVAVTDLVSDRLTSLQDTSAQARWSLWSQSLPILQAHPTGVGWGQIGRYMDPWASATSTSGEVYPHNLLLEIGTEGGWLALLVVSLVGATAWRAQRRARHSGVTETAMTGLLIFAAINAMVSGDIGDNRALWAALGAGLVWVSTPTTKERVVNPQLRVGKSRARSPA